ncbi:MFS transporter [Streptomyces coffeae]|uniref:MHS family MFS transporter n=1 Tax=Streptomyces coffeae TaxID=621382 RepID=A0ABS1NCS9_9ACTN|nr:MFS transporter [Streptomyces coffeae]MBL1097762.1 MHS family MFS transporter [Streptomyces coffeae]
MTPTDSRTSGTSQARRVAWAAFIGSTIEWYDFFLYATAAALVFNVQFFPTADPAVGSIAAFGTLAAGFVSRPLGGLVMGHFGDRYGRKNTLIASLLIMGLCTAAIGLLPTYAGIGVAAPILLTLMRVIQGIGLGGEWGGAVVMTLEHAPENRRGLYGAAPQMGVPAGLIAANLAVLGLTRALGEDAFNSWGWRIPFLLSLLLVAVGMYLRLRIEESRAYSELAEPETQKKLPVAEVLQEHWRSVLRACFVIVGNSSVAYVFMTYVLSYGKQTLHIDATFLLLSVTGGAVMWLVSAPFWGRLGDRWGLRRLFLIGGFVRVAWALAFLPVVDTGNKPLIFVFMLSMGVVLSMTHASVGVMTATMFPLKIRYTGSSAAYQIGSLLGGGITPLVAASLMKATGTSMSITLYLLAVGLISLAATKGLSRDDVGEGVSAAEQKLQPQKV